MKGFSGRGSATSPDQSIGTIPYPVDPEAWFPLRHTDWARIRSRVQSLENPTPYIGQLGWACVGIGSGALLALIPWTAADSQLPAHAQDHYAWITPLLAVVGIASFAIASICLYLNIQIRQQRRTSVAQLLDEMDACKKESDHAARRSEANLTRPIAQASTRPRRPANSATSISRPRKSPEHHRHSEPEAPARDADHGPCEFV
jgi:hypothetical protein